MLKSTNIPLESIGSKCHTVLVEERIFLIR